MLSPWNEIGERHAQEMWRDREALSKEIRQSARHSLERRLFLLADRVLSLQSDDRSLVRRFDEIYRDCATREPGNEIAIRILNHPEHPVAGLFLGEPMDEIGRFTSFVLPGREISAGEADETGWRPLMREGKMFGATNDTSAVLIRREAGWQFFAANMAVALTLRAQPQLLFFHAATSRIGRTAIMMSGPKRAGKTTLSLALAARGHSLLGDEIAAIRTENWRAVPMRRSLSIRRGPASLAVDGRLNDLQPEEEIFPDGEPRRRVPVSELWSDRAEEAPVRASYFLCGFGERPEIVPFPRGPEVMGDLQPLGWTLWRGARGVMDLARFASEVASYKLIAGRPDDTAEMVERHVEEFVA